MQYDSQQFVLFRPSDSSAQETDSTFTCGNVLRRNWIVFWIVFFYTPSLHELHHRYINMIDDDKKNEIIL